MTCSKVTSIKPISLRHRFFFLQIYSFIFFRLFCYKKKKNFFPFKIGSQRSFFFSLHYIYLIEQKNKVQQHDHYEPTQKEQDELARALEEVDEQVKSLEQMTSSSNFLDNFLDVNDEILDGSDICDEVLTTSSVKNDIRGLVHT